MTLQSKLLILLAILLAGVGFDDWRRGHAVAPAPAVMASSQIDAAPAAKNTEKERVVTELHCSDGTVVKQSDTRSDSTTAAAPARASSAATVAQPSKASTPSVYDSYIYSIRVDTNPLRPKDVGVSFGARLGNLPFEAVIGGQMNSGTPSARIGLQLDL